jgi:hypothetical protein
MRLTFASFDDALIERVFQPVADALSDRLGLNRQRTACFCIDLASVSWILSQARPLSDAVLEWDAGLAFLRLLLLLLGLVALTGLRGLFRRLSGDAKVNPLRPAMRPHRAVVLLMLVARLVELDGMSVSNVADLAMLGFTAVALYLGACAARPRVRRRVGVLEPVPQA